MKDASEITRILHTWNEGEENTLGRLIPLVYEDLRRIARRYLERERTGHTLQPTAVVNELYLRLAGRRTVRWKNRAQFFGVAAQTMRRLLVDPARIRGADKRGDGKRDLSWEEVPHLPVTQRDEELIALHEALERLAGTDPRQAKIVELRVFAGLTHEEIGALLGVTERTVKREFRTARLWLHRAVREGRRVEDVPALRSRVAGMLRRDSPRLPPPGRGGVVP